MPVMSLHKINENIGNILTRIDDEEDDTRVQLLLAELDALEMAWDEKVDNIVRFIRSLEATEKAFLEESNYFRMKARIMGNKARRLREYLRDELAAMRTKKVIVKNWRLYLQSHKRVEVVDLENVPDELKRVRYEPLKQEIMKRIKAGDEIPGVEVKETVALVIR